ncbi:MAG: hypothetical protein KZQ71_10780 [Candidatus Thiodiazotropha sp. (ex Lucinoma aequizonata)]|nr:hypothetical protein [Candidatus Thiodiazotropha sp. (ex Lucinoma aequizonata)]
MSVTAGVGFDYVRFSFLYFSLLLPPHRLEGDSADLDDYLLTETLFILKPRLPPTLIEVKAGAIKHPQ